MIKKYFCNIEKKTGFYHSIDNIKDLDMINKKQQIKKIFFCSKAINEVKKLKYIYG